MKILFSLALLLTIGSISAQSLISGTWSSPYIYDDNNTYCCVPASIEISCPAGTASSCTATYDYANIVSKCWRMFLSTKGFNKLSLSKNSYPNSDSYTSETTSYGGLKFNFEVTNSTGYPKLEITTPSYYQCNFTMQSRNAAISDPYNSGNSNNNYNNGSKNYSNSNNNYNYGNNNNYGGSSGSGGAGGFVIFIIIFFIIVASASAKKYQRRQANMIIAQNLAHQQPIATVPGFNFNTAPTVVQVHQPQIVQHQVAYTAPNQFPNAQVNMNYGGGNNVQFPNNQVNMNYGNNVQLNFNGNNGGFHAPGHY